MISKREIEIARKVREIHGQRKFQYGDQYIVGATVGLQIKGIWGSHPICEASKMAVIASALWLPSMIDYMKMLWEIDPDKFVLCDDGVYMGETAYQKDLWTFDFNELLGTPGEAWMKVVL